MGNAAKPITVQVYDAGDLKDIQEKGRIRREGTELPYYEGEGRFYFSPCDHSDRYTKKAAACLVPILAGTATNGSREQSTMAHLSMLMNVWPDLFREQFQDQLEQFKERTKPDTRTAVVVAGHVPPLAHEARDDLLADYLNRLKMIQEEIATALKIQTMVIAGPTRTPGSYLDVYYDTQKRVAGILVAQPGDFCFTESFLASDAEKISQSWS